MFYANIHNPLSLVGLAGIMHISSKPVEDRDIETAVIDVLPEDVEISLLRNGYSRLTARPETHIAVRHWFISYVPQVLEGEILEAYGRMLLTDRRPSLPMTTEREVFVLRCLFFRAYFIAREEDGSICPSSIGALVGGGLDARQVQELFRRAFLAFVSVMPPLGCGAVG